MVVLVPGVWEGSGRGAASVDKKRRGTRGEEVKLALGRRAKAVFCVAQACRAGEGACAYRS